jgi:hypothetical protein
LTLKICTTRAIETSVEFFQTLDLRDRHQEVRPTVPDHTFDNALLIAASGKTEMLQEKVVTLELKETVSKLAIAACEHLRDSDGGVVIANA